LAAIIVPTLFKGLEVVLKVKDFLHETRHFVFSDLLKLQVFVLESYYAPTNRVLGARWPSGYLDRSFFVHGG
jgi:hypothetical protein